MQELDFIDWLRRRLPAHPLVRVGVGDDAALLEGPSGADLVATTDMLMDGVDFVLAEAGPRRVGRKCLAVNLSDLAAMAAVPVAGLVSLALPRDGAWRLACELFEGLLPLAARQGLGIAGGDTNTWNGPLVVSITVLGRPAAGGPWLRSGAQAGDVLLVTGSLGGSLRGKHLDFEPRLTEAAVLAARRVIHAAIDISDGLALDASRLAAASGLGVELELAQIPIAHDALEMAAQASLPAGPTALERALGDGEDFELLLAAAPHAAAELVAEQPLGVPLTAIGRFVNERGLWQSTAAGPVPLAARGYQHEFRA